MLFQILNPVSLFLEGTLLMVMMHGPSDVKYRLSTIVRILLASVLYAVGMIWLSDIQYQYQLVYLIWRMALVFGLSFLVVRLSWKERLLIVNFCLFLFLTTGYIVMFVGVLLMESPHDLYIALTLIRLIRRIQLITALIRLVAQIALVFLMQKFIKRLLDLESHLYLPAFFLLITGIIMTAILMQMITQKSILLSQAAVIISWIFINVSLCAVLITFVQTSFLRRSCRENELMAAMNASVSAAYEIVAQKNDELRKQAHDFRGHLETIKRLDSEDSSRYIADLESASSAKLVNSGDRFVDAVINSKLLQMTEADIHFEHNIRIPHPLQLSKPDLCAIISNQLDNAMEACLHISDLDARWIRYNIDQRGEMLLLQCENSIVPGSVIDTLSTSKSDTNAHGFGIINIQACAERHHGSLTNEILESSFISTVTLMDDF